MFTQSLRRDPKTREILVKIETFTYPFPPNQFDQAFSFWLTSHYPDIALLTEVWTVIAPALKNEIQQAAQIVISDRLKFDPISRSYLVQTLDNPAQTYPIYTHFSPFAVYHTCIAPHNHKHTQMEVDIGYGRRPYCAYTLAAQLDLIVMTQPFSLLDR